WELFKVVFGPEGGALKPWEAGEWLAEPAHQIYAARPGDSPWDLCFFLNELSDGTWKFGRNHAITRPPGEIVIRTSNGIPIMSPEIQLAYKAKQHQPRDEHDFERAHERLTPAQRVWLRETLQLCHPGDPWINRL
ncbi:MAG TPA: hypothetical protein VER55_03685, partial [Ardenticatenaceae bacterium]|nr:hypothetical protein [Ardenticatenaceae bacterium]